MLKARRQDEHTVKWINGWFCSLTLENLPLTFVQVLLLMA